MLHGSAHPDGIEAAVAPGVDALDLIQGRARSLARTPDGLERPSRPEMVEAMRAFSGWFRNNRAEGSLFMTGDSIIEIRPDLGVQFCIGFSGFRAFLGVPASEAGWFREFPWLHLAVKPGSQRVSLVCEKVVLGDRKMPTFALAFEVPTGELATMLANHHFIDIKRIIGPLRTVEREGDDEAVLKTTSAIERKILMTIEIRRVTDDQTLPGLIADRRITGHTNRSLFREPMKR